MAVRDLYATVTDVTGITEITYTEGLSEATATVVVTCESHGHTIGSVVDECDLGWSDDHAVLLTGGIVKHIEYLRQEALFRLTIRDVLVRAVDNFLAPDDPEVAFMADNITAEDLVGELLSNSGLTSYTGEATGFTMATSEPTPIKLVSAWDAIRNLCRITGRICFADSAGMIHFETRKPYIVGGDTSVLGIIGGAGGNLERVVYTISDEGLRNRVVVYGLGEVHATATGSSPYLPTDYYKSMVIAHELIGSEAQAQASADLNLLMFNRLTETLTCNILGDQLARARAIVDFTDAFCGLDEDLFVVFRAQHTINKDAGYSTAVTLVR